MTTAVVVAAGRGERLSRQQPKALVEVAGRPLVAHAVAGLRAAGLRDVVVVHTPGERPAFAAALGDADVVLVEGGATRTGSVRAGVAATPPSAGVVAVHDAARAFTPPEVIRTVVAAVTGDVLAAAPGLPVADTLKRVDGAQVVGTTDRTGLVAVQTPQVFPLEVLRAVLDATDEATDELALVERAVAAGTLSGRVVWVPGSLLGWKLTYPADLAAAERLAGPR